MAGPIELSIIIPAYREGPEFSDRLQELDTYLLNHDLGRVEILVILQSDLTTDQVPTLLESQIHHQFGPQRSIINLGGRAGKGGAVRAGMLAARGRYRLFMDADLATPLHHLSAVQQFMVHGGQVGIAVRDLIKTHPGWKRKLITAGGNLLTQLVLLPGIKDTQCGFKVFSAPAAEQIFNCVTIKGWGFDLEVLALARKFGYRIETFKVTDWHDPKAAAAGLVGDSVSGAAVEVLKALFHVRWRLLTGQYNHHDSSPHPNTT